MTLVRSVRLIRIALRGFRRSPVRTLLAIVAAAGGTAGLIACMGYAAAGREKVLDQFRRMGSNLLVITPVQSRAVGGRARTGARVTTLREPDYRALLSWVPDISASSPTVSTVLRIRAGDLTKQATVIGCMPAWFAIRKWDVASGVQFTAADDREARPVALLGATAARELFESSDPAGQQISINRVPFTVAGVMVERGQGLDASDEDAQVYVPLRTAMLRLTNLTSYESIVLQLGSWSSMDAAAREVNALLTERHRFADPSGPDFQVQNQKSLIDAQLATLGRMNFLLRSIAASLLMVGALGIFGVAWIGIGHRMREIGTCRAIGARVSDMLLQFFAESLIGPVIGCATGVAFSWLALRWLDQRAGQPLLFPAPLAAEAAIGSVALYTLTALLCALRTTRIAPSVALRAE